MSFNPLYVGAQSKSSSRQVVTNYTNATAFAIPQGTPVSTNTSGMISPTDVTNETSVNQFVGHAQFRISASSLGPVISGGRLENIVTAFAVGDPIYIGHGGTLINQKPDVGIAGFMAGDWVMFVGVLVKNEFNPSLTDIQLCSQIIGEL